MKRCEKCRRNMDDSLFICPHCGAIYGEPVYHKHTTQPADKKRILTPVLALLCVMILVILVALGGFRKKETVAYSVRVLDLYENPIQGIRIEFRIDGDLAGCVITDNDGLASIQARSHANVTAAVSDNHLQEWIVEGKRVITLVPDSLSTIYLSLISGEPILIEMHEYSITIINDIHADMEHVKVTFLNAKNQNPHVYTLDSANRATHTFTKTEEPAQVQIFGVNYRYPDGVYTMSLYLSDIVEITELDLEGILPQKRTYTVKVIDNDGNPVADALVAFANTNPLARPKAEQNILCTVSTDETGTCTYTDYDARSYYAYVLSLPNGYYCDWTASTEIGESREITLHVSNMDAPHPDDQDIYIVSIVSTSLQPLADLDIAIYYQIDGVAVRGVCRTNGDGSFYFLCDIPEEKPVELQIKYNGDLHTVQIVLEGDRKHYVWAIS